MGFVAGEGPGNLGGALAFTTTEPVTGYAPVGSYSITPSGLTSANYAITFASGTLTVSQATLTVSGITAANKVYDGTTAATLNTTGAVLVGVLSGDTISLGTSGAVGTFTSKNGRSGVTVNISGLTISGAEVSDYTLGPPSTTATITARPITAPRSLAARVTTAQPPRRPRPLSPRQPRHGRYSSLHGDLLQPRTWARARRSRWPARSTTATAAMTIR